MYRRHFLEMGSAAHLAVQAAAPSRPNILFLMTDQQSHTAWSGAKNPWLATPAMDSLAATGTVFEESYCNYPVCSPSRGSIFSSRLPHETGVMNNNQGINPGLPTMGDVFRDAGYKTAYAGKWHLPKTFDGMTGFEKIAGGHNLGAQMDEPVASACEQYLKQAKASEPFLLVASFMNPHDICDWIRQHPGSRVHPKRHKYPPAPGNMLVDPQEPETIQYHRSAGYDLMSQAVGIAAKWQRDDFRHYLHDYYRMVESVDAQIGRVLAALRSTGLLSNTLVAFTSDHGEGMGGHRWVQKASFWEESVHVPLILSGPGVKPGHRACDLVSLMDLFPTFCDYAGLKAPPGARGVSLRASLEGRAQPRQYVTSHLRYDSIAREGRMLRTERFKYICHNSGQRPELLYDLLTDPGECRNLASEAGGSAILAQHRLLLQQELLATKDPFRPAL